MSDSTVFDPEDFGVSSSALRHVDELMSSRSLPKGSGRMEWAISQTQFGKIHHCICQPKHLALCHAKWSY